MPAPLKPLRQTAFDDHRRQQREGVERCADAAQQQHDGERLTRLREAPRRLDRRHGEHRQVERVPRALALDPHVAEGAAGDDGNKKGDREARTLRPKQVVSAADL